jgi:hypothetical protein
MTRRFRWLMAVLALIPFIGALVWRIGPGSLGFAQKLPVS